DRRLEAAVGAEDHVVARCETDAFGDFKIDRLDPASGGYTVKVAHEGFAAHSIEFELGDSVTLGTIRLSPG
ncbi:MAG: hypothetical protein O6831_05720, partial [Alphaproteobacteria bacterium]|nr:hypothetical protein [Alphaproteobacteria bacterium]